MQINSTLKVESRHLGWCFCRIDEEGLERLNRMEFIMQTTHSSSDSERPTSFAIS